MKAVHFRRLEKLCAFLDKLPRKRFDFDVVHSADSKCNSIGCAVGWTPSVFPRLVKWYGDTVSTYNNFGYLNVACELFGMLYDTADNIFTPGLQGFLHPSLPTCNSSATPKQVARMLRKFMALVKKGEIRP